MVTVYYYCDPCECETDGSFEWGESDEEKYYSSRVTQAGGGMPYNRTPVELGLPRQVADISDSDVQHIIDDAKKKCKGN